MHATLCLTGVVAVVISAVAIPPGCGADEKAVDPDQELLREAKLSTDEIAFGAISWKSAAEQHFPTREEQFPRDSYLSSDDPVVVERDPKLLSLDQLLVQLADANPHLRQQAAMMLGRYSSPEAEVVVPPLLTALRDDSAQVRESAARSLASFPSLGERIVPALCECLNDSHRPVVVAAALSLGYMGSASKQAVPSLLKLLKERHSEVRCGSLSTLRAMKRNAAAAVPTLVEALRDQSYSDYWPRIASALGGIGSQSEEAIPILLLWIQGQDNNLRYTAVEVWLIPINLQHRS